MLPEAFFCFSSILEILFSAPIWPQFFPVLCLSSVPSGPGEEMGAKASLLEGPGPGSALFPSPTLENIQAAYEEKQEEVARELIQQACCVECSAGMPRIDGVRTAKTYRMSAALWLKRLKTNNMCLKYKHGSTLATRAANSYLLKSFHLIIY